MYPLALLVFLLVILIEIKTFLFKTGNNSRISPDTIMNSPRFVIELGNSFFVSFQFIGDFSQRNQFLNLIVNILTSSAYCDTAACK